MSLDDTIKIYKWKWSSQLCSYVRLKILRFICKLLMLLHNCEDHFHLYSLTAVHSYDLYHIHITIKTVKSVLKFNHRYEPNIRTNYDE